MRTTPDWLRSFATLIAVLTLPSLALAQDAGTPDPETFEDLYPGKTYSPYAQRAFPSQVYWGDTHLHTGMSLDAGLFGNTLGLEEAYRFARGEEVTSSGGLPVKLSRPLDWLVITDHSDMMGFAIDLQRGAPHILADPKGREWYEGFSEGGEAAGIAAFDLITNFTQGTFPEELASNYAPDGAVYSGVWDNTIAAAESFNDPGRFTAFIGFEWTSIPQGNNLHRNVVLRDGGDRAGQVIPMTTQPPLGSTDPLDLYQWLENYEANTGGQAFALAHNGNLSNGWMFPTEDTYAGGTVDLNYVELRARWEPLYEVTQIKGDGEAHPALSPNDEFADYETWDIGNLDLTALKEPDMLQREYAREALKQGLALEEEFGTNPYKFGLVGATDSHTSLSTAEEENFFGKSTSVEPSATRVQHPFASSDLGVWEGYGLVASGYQGVWATAFVGYEKGVPMGSDLTDASGGSAPTFMAYALRDPIGANLDRIQIIKGWLDASGETQEQIYDVAVSDGRTIGTDGRARTPVGNTVDIEAANWTNTIGASELAAVWTDPEFDPEEKAFYYARVLEIPTPRWVLYDKVRLGAEIPDEAELIHQERAYTSPIWYTP
jgi:hypothetical protein